MPALLYKMLLCGFTNHYTKRHTTATYAQISFPLEAIKVHNVKSVKLIEIDLLLAGSTAPEGGRFTVAPGEDINNAAVWRRQTGF